MKRGPTCHTISSRCRSGDHDLSCSASVCRCRCHKWEWDVVKEAGGEMGLTLDMLMNQEDAYNQRGERMKIAKDEQWRIREERKKDARVREFEATL